MEGKVGVNGVSGRERRNEEEVNVGVGGKKRR